MWPAFSLTGSTSTGSSTIPRPTALTYPSGSFSPNLAEVEQQLLEASVAPTTRHFYQKCWDKFSHFVCQITGATLNFSVQSKFVSQYVAYLYTQDFAPATISSHLSAISFFHSIAGHSDPCNTDIIRRMTAGCRKLRTQHDNRLPLLLPHIQSLVHATFHILSGSPYQQAMYQSIILLAFFGFFRIGELLQATPSKNNSVVQSDTSHYNQKQSTLNYIITKPKNLKNLLNL